MPDREKPFWQRRIGKGGVFVARLALLVAGFSGSGVGLAANEAAMSISAIARIPGTPYKVVVGTGLGDDRISRIVASEYMTSLLFVGGGAPNTTVSFETHILGSYNYAVGGIGLLERYPNYNAAFHLDSRKRGNVHRVK